MSTGGKMVARVCAVEYICRMHGGSQAKLVRCSDGKYYVVKFQNNPQGAKTLANELLATLLAKWLGLPVPEPAIVEVHPDLIQYTDELIIEQRHRKVRCRPGLCFGSLYANGEPSPSNPIGWCKVLPEGELGKVHNAEDFLGMLVFNKWVGNMDTCQTTFVRNYSLRHPYHVRRLTRACALTARGGISRTPPGAACIPTAPSMRTSWAWRHSACGSCA